MLLSAHGANSHAACEPSSPEDRVMTDTFKVHVMRQVLIKFDGEKSYPNRTQGIHGRDSV